jgi:endogenous inhibitor of DNA gyrase (YacG/DUF329 family)
MNALQKEQIRRMRQEGSGYSRIAQGLGLSENTVKSYCKRNSLGGIGATLPKLGDVVCRNCDKPVPQLPGRKKRVFCSDACRVVWWNTHPGMVRRKAVYSFTCAYCGASFESYGNQKRKYCSHVCYIVDRFGKRAAGITI